MRGVRFLQGDGDGVPLPSSTDADFERDAAMVTADLARLKELLESA